MKAFYLNRLTGSDRQLYMAADDALGCRRMRSVLPAAVSTGRLLTAARYVTLDHPGYYWSKGDFSAAVSRDGEHLLIRWDDLCAGQLTEETDRIIFSGIEQMRLDRYSSVRDRVGFLQEWFLRNVRYEWGRDRQEQRRAQTPVSVFMERRSACLGFARAAKMALDLYGTDCIIVLGRLFGDTRYDHAWNLVRDGDCFRHVDFTIRYPQFESLWRACYPDRPQSCLLLPFGDIAKSHQTASGLSYPE